MEMKTCVLLFALSLLLAPSSQVEELPNPPPYRALEYELEFYWNWINFTWPSYTEYAEAVSSGEYIKENVEITSIEYWDGKLFFALPKFRPGVPWSLAHIHVKESRQNYPLLTPYPDYQLSKTSKDLADCAQRLDNARTLQITPMGDMWILDDGDALNAVCPEKLMILDSQGEIVLSHEFTHDVCPNFDCILNGLRIDLDGDNTYAYISDSGSDPGLIVFSLEQKKFWKLRDVSMYGHPGYSLYFLDNESSTVLVNTAGLALSPPGLYPGTKKLFYSAFSSVDLYAIDTAILKREPKGDWGNWRKEIEYVGNLGSQVDELIFDSEGVLYSTQEPWYAVGAWNSSFPFGTARIVIQDRLNICFGESFTLDDLGTLRLLSNNLHKYANLDIELGPFNTRKTVIKATTGSKSYFHPPSS